MWVGSEREQSRLRLGNQLFVASECRTFDEEQTRFKVFCCLGGLARVAQKYIFVMAAEKELFKAQAWVFIQAKFLFIEYRFVPPVANLFQSG